MDFLHLAHVHLQLQDSEPLCPFSRYRVADSLLEVAADVDARAERAVHGRDEAGALDPAGRLQGGAVVHDAVVLLGLALRATLSASDL